MQLEPKIMGAIALAARHSAVCVGHRFDGPVFDFAGEHMQAGNRFVACSCGLALLYKSLPGCRFRTTNLHLIQNEFAWKDLTPTIDAAGEVVN